jgi:hypothetical protein
MHCTKTINSLHVPQECPILPVPFVPFVSDAELGRFHRFVGASWEVESILQG